MSIPEPRSEGTLKYLSESVALNPYKGDVEGEPFLISFRFYNDKMCEIKHLKSSSSKRFINNIRTIGKCNYSSLKANGIGTDRVENSGEYKKLFNKLPEDVEFLLEHKGAQESRLFYFWAGAILFIIAFTQNHLETGKTRR